MKLKLSLITVLFLIIPFSTAFSLGTRSDSERILRENSEFIDFLNISITNFGEDKNEQFAKAFTLHCRGDYSYMTGNHINAYNDIRDSQIELASISSDMLQKVYIDEAKKTLAAIAAYQVKNHDDEAYYFLSSGLAEVAQAEKYLTIGQNSYRKVFSYKVFKYEEGIQRIRRAFRCAFMSLFSALDDEIQIKVYNEMVRVEKEEGRGNYYSRFLGKEGESFDEEMMKTYEDEEFRSERENSEKSISMERKMESKKRFKKEARTAKFIKHRDMNFADYSFREQIPDFNFRLINAMLTVIAGDKTVPDLDYEKMRIYLSDSYLMMTKNSSLETIRKNVKPEDLTEREEKDASQEKSDQSSSAEKEGAGDHSEEK